MNTDLFIAYGIISTGIAMLIFLIANAFKKEVKPSLKRAGALLLRNTLQETENAHTLATYFSDATGSTNYKINGLWGSFLADRFLELLKQNTPVTVLSEYCNRNRRECNSIVKVVGSKGNTIVIALRWTEERLKDKKDRNRFVSTAFDINDYAEKDDDNNLEIVYSHGMDICYPSTIAHDHEDIEEILRMYDLCRIDAVNYYEHKIMNRLWRMSAYKGEYNLDPTESEVPVLDAARLDASYEPVDIEFQGESCKLEMSKAKELALYALQQGENLYISGSYGTGKSKLVQQLQVSLSNNGSNNVIMLSPGLINELQGASAQSSFIKSLAAIARAGAGRTIICIDEVEKMLLSDEHGIHSEANTLLLQMLDGSLHDELNCSMILVFNADPNRLNPAMFRRGRMGLHYEVRPLTKSRADKLVTIMQDAFVDKVFDKETYSKLVQETNFLPGNLKYAETGEVTLGDVYDCFVDRDKRNLVIEMLRQQSGKPVRTATPASPVVPVVSKPQFSTIAPAKAVVVSDAAPVAEPGSQPLASSIQSHKRNRRKKKR